MIETIIRWNEQKAHHCPDSIRLVFYTFPDHCVFGTWDSDHDEYSDDNSQPIGEVLYWAYCPKLQLPFPNQIIATDKAAMKLYQAYQNDSHNDRCL